MFLRSNFSLSLLRSSFLLSLLRRAFTLLLPVMFVLAINTELSAWPGYQLRYKEQLYSLYHRHLTMYPEKYAENIYWLEQVLRSDFANPLNALGKIETKREWEWYRNHFNMHVHLLLTKLYLGWGKKYAREKIYFYNAPWKRQNIDSLNTAMPLFEFAKVYWQLSLNDVKKIDDMEEFFLSVPGIEYWEDEYLRIKLKTLNYEKIITREIEKAELFIAEFQAMDESTY